jgi:hypothetical protein
MLRAWTAKLAGVLGVPCLWRVVAGSFCRVLPRVGARLHGLCLQRRHRLKACLWGQTAVCRIGKTWPFPQVWEAENVVDALLVCGNGQAIKAVHDEYKGRVVIVTTNIKGEHANTIVEYFGLSNTTEEAQVGSGFCHSFAMVLGRGEKGFAISWGGLLEPIRPNNALGCFWWSGSTTSEAHSFLKSYLTVIVGPPLASPWKAAWPLNTTLFEADATAGSHAACRSRAAALEAAR